MKALLFSAFAGTIILASACSDSNHTDSATTTLDSTIAAPVTAMGDSAVKKQIELTSAQEVPANTSAGKGTADLSYNKTSHMLTYTVNYSGLTGPATMAHIHGTAPIGVNAGVKHDLSSLLQKAAAGSFTDSVIVDGTSLIQVSLMSGLYYFNIHTAAHPGGEIRGQIDL